MTGDDKKLVSAMLEALADIKAENPAVLDLRKLTTMTDYFLIAHGRNTRQVQAMAKAIEERLREQFDAKPNHIEGAGAAQWILMDYGGVIAHLFLDEKRTYYDLERIWMDAPRVTP